ncbi:MAG TPA: PAS domain S-box protein [Blastocatellia bacterium]|nr:PAS domain S-box protein [Blastocatellia bacterium]
MRTKRSIGQDSKQTPGVSQAVTSVERGLQDQRLALYEAVFANAIDGIAIIDAQGFYLQQNGAHRALLGFSDEELMGKTPALHFGDEVFAQIAEQLAATGSFRGEFTSRPKSGEPITVELSAFAVNDAAGQPLCFVGIKRNTSGRKQTEQQLRDRIEQLQAIYQLSAAVSRAEAIEEIYDEALTGMQRALKIKKASILLFDPDGVMRFKGWRGLSDEYRKAVEGHSPWSRGTRDARPIFVTDVTQEASLGVLRETILGEGIRAMAFIPLVYQTRLLGKFMVYYDAPHEFPAEEVQLVQTIASHVAFAIEQKQADEAVRRREQEWSDFFENAPIGLHWVGPDGTILRANRAELEMLGYTRDEYVNHHIAEFHADKETIDDILQRLSNTETLKDYEARLRCKDGSIKQVLITSNVHWDDNRFVHTRCFTRDITGRREAERASLHMAAIVESSDDAIISKTLDGTIMSWNRGAQRIFGYTAEEAIGRNITMLIPTDRLQEEPEILARIKRGERIDHYETIRKTRDGCLINISVTISPVKDSSDRIIAASKIARDITEQKRAEKEREQLLARERAARAEAEAANRAKDAFLATVSHEVRTPLNAILGWARILHAGKLDPEMQARALETIDRNAKAQAQIIEDLLDVSRIITGKLRLDVRPVGLTAIIEAAADAVRPAAEAKNIQLDIDLDYEAGLVSGDPDRLQQVVWNLLSNAIKFTPVGGRVSVQLERVGAEARIRVSDSGRGISAEFMPYLFDRFSQADSSLTRKHGGLGLGLAIVRHLIELHGGTVAAESEGEGRGATFEITLPLAIRPEMRRNIRSTSEYEFSSTVEPAFDPQISLSGLRVLVVDDDDDARELVTTVLTQCGAEVNAVASVGEALAVLEQFEADVMVSDIEMPGEDGYSLIRKVRAIGDGAGRIAAAALTAHARTEDRLRALAAGFDTHVAKPVEPSELIAVVASIARRIAKV